jgi:hypothetical protein
MDPSCSDNFLDKWLKISYAIAIAMAGTVEQNAAVCFGAAP